MAFYSFTAIAQQPVGIPDPMILLDKGLNVFTAHTDDLDGLLKQLEDEGVTVTQVNRLDQHEENQPGDLLLPGESADQHPLLLDVDGQEADS